MTDLETILEHLRLLAVQHAPDELLQRVVPFALVCLIAGIGLSVLGAKLARFGLVSGFVLWGGYAGARFAGEASWPTPLCSLAGALMGGIIAYQTFRLWVGLAAAVVLSSIALSVFSYQRIVPRVEDFARAEPLTSVEGPPLFALPSPRQQQAYRERSPRQWVSEFWAFVTKQDAQIEPKGKALAIAAMFTGLCLGVLAVRSTLILATSLIGTGLVTSAIATLTTHSIPQFGGALRTHPGLVGVAVGGFLFTSLILQTMLTRKAPPPKASPPIKP